MSGNTVLVVDDESSFLEIMNMILPRAGYRVLTTTDGEEGLEMIHRHQPDVALLDDMLPGLSGGDICLRVKSDPLIRHIPVILYSAGPRVRDAAFVRQIGANAVLYKPFKPGDVVKVINSCFGLV